MMLSQILTEDALGEMQQKARDGWALFDIQMATILRDLAAMRERRELPPPP